MSFTHIRHLKAVKGIPLPFTPCRHLVTANTHSRFGIYERLVQPALSSPTVSRRLVPDSVPKPHYASDGELRDWASEIHVHDDNGIRRMREAGALARRVLALGGEMCLPGTTTDEIDAALHNATVLADAY